MIQHSAAVRGEEEKKTSTHLLWYVPVCAAVAVAIIIPTALLGFGNIRALLGHFQWMILLSPSFYVFCATTINSLIVPINLLRHMPQAARDSAGHRLRAILIELGLLTFWSVVFQVVIWGAYPLGYDAKGYEHIRLIPFLPWPSTSFLHWIWD